MVVGICDEQIVLCKVSPCGSLLAFGFTVKGTGKGPVELNAFDFAVVAVRMMMRPAVMPIGCCIAPTLSAIDVAKVKALSYKRPHLLGVEVIFE